MNVDGRVVMTKRVRRGSFERIRAAFMGDGCMHVRRTALSKASLAGGKLWKVGHIPTTQGDWFIL
jgi:hypothetical protein